MSSPWSGDDSDHQRAGMGMGIGVDPGPETCSNKKPRLGSMPETASLGVDPGNAACLKHEHVTHTCYDTDGSSNIGISMCDNFHKRRRPVPTATPGTKKQRGTNHRIPWGHALAHMNISYLEDLTRGQRHIYGQTWSMTMKMHTKSSDTNGVSILLMASMKHANT